MVGGGPYLKFLFWWDEFGEKKCVIFGMSSGKKYAPSYEGDPGGPMWTNVGPIGDLVTRDFSNICLNALITPYGL